MAGVLLASIVAGRLITRTGRIKPYIVAGSVVLVAGFALLGILDHDTPLWFVGLGMFGVGIGVGMTMQNLVLAVQNTVSLKDIGAASASVAFFRSLGGAIGVSVLGAVLARRVADQITHDLAAAGVPAGGGSGNLNMTALPAPIQHIVRAAYGDATGHIFLISAAIAVVGVVAAALLRPKTLRTSLDLADQGPPPEADVAGRTAEVGRVARWSPGQWTAARRRPRQHADRPIARGRRRRRRRRRRSARRADPAAAVPAAAGPGAARPHPGDPSPPRP